jgi:hypothetical protein
MLGSGTPGKIEQEAMEETEWQQAGDPAGNQPLENLPLLPPFPPVKNQNA